jgi:hypothetical protein
MFVPHRPHTLWTIVVTGLLGLVLGLALGTSLPTTSRAHFTLSPLAWLLSTFGSAHAQGGQARFSRSAFDAPAALATGTQDATGVAASSERNVAVDAYSTAGIAMRGRNNGSGDGVEGISAGGVGGFFAGGAAALHLVPALTAGHPLSGLHLRGALLMDRTGTLWVCVASGMPGTWHQILTAAN